MGKSQESSFEDGDSKGKDQDTGTAERTTAAATPVTANHNGARKADGTKWPSADEKFDVCYGHLTWQWEDGENGEWARSSSPPPEMKHRPMKPWSPLDD
jgi:hypothetical protein